MFAVFKYSLRDVPSDVVDEESALRFAVDEPCEQRVAKLFFIDSAKKRGNEASMEALCSRLSAINCYQSTGLLLTCVKTDQSLDETSPDSS